MTIREISCPCCNAVWRVHEDNLDRIVDGLRLLYPDGAEVDVRKITREVDWTAPVSAEILGQTVLYACGPIRPVDHGPGWTRLVPGPPTPRGLIVPRHRLRRASRRALIHMLERLTRQDGGRLP